MLCRLLHFVTCTNKRISGFRCKSYGNKVNESFSTFFCCLFRTVHTVHYFSFSSKPVFIKCITIGNENAFATRLHVMSFKTCFSYVLKDMKPWFQCVISLYVCTLCMHLRAFVFVICDLFSYTGFTSLSCVFVAFHRTLSQKVFQLTRLCRFVLANLTLVQNLNYEYMNTGSEQQLRLPYDTYRHIATVVYHSTTYRTVSYRIVAQFQIVDL